MSVDIVVDLLIHFLFCVVGVFMIVGTLISAVQTFVVPRQVRSRITILTFVLVGNFFSFWARKLRTFAERDRWMAFYAPISLLILPVVWASIVIIGYMFIFWSLNTPDWVSALRTSGSCYFTLGFATLDRWPIALIGFTEASIGLTLLALLIAFLPTMYSSFSQREKAVTLLEVRAGSPPSAAELFIRFQNIPVARRAETLQRFWEDWENWFVDIDETHTSLPPINFFRSPQPERSWITAAGTVLDVSALAISTVEGTADVQANLCLRAGVIALRHIGSVFKLRFDPDPQPNDPISIDRSEFNNACQKMKEAGVLLKPDLDQAWKDFAGWRVNYDTLLLDLANVLMAPPAPWLSQKARHQRKLKFYPKTGFAKMIRIKEENKRV